MLRPIVMSLLRPAAYVVNALENQVRFRALSQHNLAFATRSRLADHVTLFDHAAVHDCVIGRHTYVGAYAVVAHADIGAFCSIGPGVRIGPGRHPTSGFTSTHPIFYSTSRHTGVTFSDRDAFEEHRRTRIGPDVWIGANAVIADGVVIGAGAIVAAGAVVAHDVDPYDIVGGVPARRIRARFSPDQIELLIVSRWWEREDGWLRAHVEALRNIDLLRDLAPTT